MKINNVYTIFAYSNNPFGKFMNIDNRNIFWFSNKEAYDKKDEFPEIIEITSSLSSDVISKISSGIDLYLAGGNYVELYGYDITARYGEVKIILFSQSIYMENLVTHKRIAVLLSPYPENYKEDYNFKSSICYHDCSPEGYEIYMLLNKAEVNIGKVVITNRKRVDIIFDHIGNIISIYTRSFNRYAQIKDLINKLSNDKPYKIILPGSIITEEMTRKRVIVSICTFVDNLINIDVLDINNSFTYFSKTVAKVLDMNTGQIVSF